MIVIPAPSGFPAIQFATGELDSNAQNILTPMVGPFPELTPTQCYVSAPGGSVFSPSPSSVTAWFSAKDGKGSFGVTQNYPNKQIIYTLNRTNGALTSGGGADSFFDFADAPTGMTLENGITLKFSGRVSSASVGYDTNYPNAAASGIVLAQGFLGAILVFNDILDSSVYDSSMPSILLFLQFPFLESNSNFGEYKNLTVLCKNRAQIIAGRLVPGTTALPFSPCPWHNYTFDLNAALADTLAQVFPANNAWNGVGYTIPSVCQQRLDKWVLKNLYLGSELENALAGGPSEGSVTLGLQLTWPVGDNVAERSDTLWWSAPGVCRGAPSGTKFLPLNDLPGFA
jgi:hypothetical protein